MAEEFIVDLPIGGSDVRQISIGNSQSSGRRPYQEDSFGYTRLDQADIIRDGFIAVVSDGMGGLAAGDKVSAYSVAAMQQMRAHSSDAQPVHVRFTQMINAISDQVYQSGTGGGATLVAVYCTTGGIYWCTTGDSRIYLYRNGRIHQLNRDFDYMEQLLDRVLDGGLTFAQADGDPKRDSLAEYVGSGEQIHPDVNIKPFIPETGDKLLLCTDGVYNAVSPEELSAELAKPAQPCADGITAAVLGKQYENQDNLTSVVLEFR